MTDSFDGFGVYMGIQKVKLADKCAWAVPGYDVV